MTGSGKSTLAKSLANKYGIKYISGGDSLKALAIEIGYKPGGRDWWETEAGRRFLQQRMKETNFDKKVDEKLMKLAGKGNVVIDSWTMPWLLKEGFKIWLEASSEVRAMRIAARGSISSESALRVLMERDERTGLIYKKLYGFNLGEDFSPFDVVLDVTHLSEDEVFQTISLLVDRFQSD